MNHLYLSAIQNQQTRPFRVWKFLWAVSLIFSAFLAQAQPCSTSINFSSPIATGPAQAPNTWYTDRYAPAGFVAQSSFGGDDRLKHSIASADGAATRPANQQTPFYNTQGRTLDLISGVKSLEIKLYIPSGWASSNKRMAGLWGTATDAGNATSAFPILEFTSDGNNPRFRAYETGTGAWNDLALPSGFSYDQWVTLRIQLLSSGEFQYTVVTGQGNLQATTTTSSADASKQIANAILQGYNYDPAQALNETNTGVTYDIYWDDFLAKAGDGVVTNTNTNQTFCSIQAAIDAPTTLDGHTIVVSAGTYTENVLVNKALTINGPNVGIPGTGVRGAEAILSDGTINVTGTGNVVIDGFHIYKTNGVANVVLLAGESPVTIRNSKFERVSTTTGEFTRAIVTSSGSGVKNITNNLFTGSTAGGLFSQHRTWQSGIYLNAASSTVNVTGNTFENIRSAINIDDLSAGISISGNTFNTNGTHLALGGSSPTGGSYVFGANTFNAPADGLANLVNVDNTFRLDISASTFNGANFNTSSLTGLFGIESRLYHRGRAGRKGLVTFVTGNQYVIATLTTIQSAVDYGTSGDIIHVKDGTYNEDVVITKALTLQGESRDGTILKGLLKDGTAPTALATPYSLVIDADDVTVKNITVTRDYNGNQAGWNASQKSYGLIIENRDRLTVDNVLVKDNRNGVFLHNTKNTVVKNSSIVANRTGFQVFGPLDNTQIINNFITGNFTHGFLFNFDQGPTSAPGMKISNNNISGNWYTQISFQRAAATPAGNVGDLSSLDLTCNWYGAAPTATVGPVSAPGYTDQTTSQFGGTAPATTLYIAGEEAAGKNFVPYLNNGTDNDGAAGFQPVPNSCVSPIHNLTHAKDFGTIQAAINDPITEPGDVIKIDAGTYTENFTVTKNLTFEGTNKDICGTNTRGAETILIAPATPTGVITLGASVSATFNGFKIDGLGVAYLTQANQSLTVKNSVFELDFVPSQNNLYSGSSAVILDCNYFKAIGGTNDGGSSSHIFIGNGSLTATNNKFTSETAVSALTGGTTSLPVWINLTANASNFSVQRNIFTKVDIGILLAANAGGGTIQNNEFSEAKRNNAANGYGTAIAIFDNYTPASAVTIQNNKFYSSETGIRTSVDGSGPYNFPATNLLTISNNSFETISDGSFRIGNQFNSSANPLQATCNWFNNASVVTGNPANITYLPKLVSGTDESGDIGFQTSAACVSPIQNLTHPKYFATIQAAINDPITEPGDVIKIDAGTYTENFTVTKNLTFEGANKDICGTNTRGAETILIAPATPTGVITLGASVSATFNGFKIDGLGVAYLTQANQSLTVKNSVFELDFVPSQNNLYSGSSAVILDCNYFKAIGGTNDGGSSSHIFIGNGSLTATNNKFTSETAVSALTGGTTSLPVWINLTANTSSFLVQTNIFSKVDIGILLASNAGGGTIQANEFSDAKRGSYPGGSGFGTGIAIFGNYTPAAPVTIQNNKFYNSETGIRTSSGDASNNFPTASQLTISNNSFETISDGSFRIGNSYNSSTNALNATCNWFNNAAVVTGNPANITYLPKLISGTDDSPAIGFQTSAACLLPVHNITKNTYFATIQAAVSDAGTTNGDEIVASDGTYNERVTVSKQVKLTGASKTGTILDGTGLAGTGSGIFINDGITNVTIRNFTIQNFTGSSGNSHAGVYANAGNNNLTVTDVVIKNNPSASGIYANGPVSDVLIDKVDALNNGPAARGIVIWNGLKKNITITNSNVQSNTCCGIELQDGSATGILIRGNTIVGNDNAIGLVGLTSGSGLGKANIIENNTITVNGRFGIEVKNPNGTGHDVDTEDGAIIIRSNTVTFGSTTDQRDLAGIAVYRRGVLAGNVDVPTGVVVKNNTVSGFKQPSSSDGFGIVVEGTNHTVTGNTLNNNDVGIQLQAGYGGYPGDGDQSNLADTYFGRGNSPLTCGNTIAPNTFSGNAANTRDVGSSTGGGTVTNTTTNKTFCSIQSAINDATTLNGHTITVGAGTYNEEVTVSKSLTLTGANVGIAGNGSRVSETVIDGNIGTHSGFVVTVSNVTIDGFRINGAAGTYGAGVYSSPTTSGLVLQNNVISDNAIGAYPSSNGASWVKRNLFVANNRPGAAGGAGIYVEATNALTIDGNEFRGHTNNSAVIFGASAPNAHQNLVFTNNNVHDNNNANSMVYLSGVNSATISSNTVVQSGTTAIKVAGGNANISLTNNVLNGNTTAIKVQNDGVGPNTGVQATNNSLVSTKSVDNQDVNNVSLTCNYFGVTNYTDVLAKLVTGSTGKNLLNSIATTNTYSSCISPAGLALVASATATCVGSPSSVTATGLLASTSTIVTYAINDGTPQTYTATTTAAGELIISALIPAGSYTLRVTALEANGTVTTINPPLSVTGMVQSSVVAGTVSGTSPIAIGGTTTYTNTGGSPGGTWSSSNPAVATVNNAGLVTGVASGTANIIYTVTGCGGPVSSQATVTVQGSDLAPGIYGLPNTLYGTAPFTVVVDVFELNPVPTNGTITVIVSRDSRFNLTFNQNATFIGNRVVQNGSWTLDGTDPDFYILTTTASISAGGKLSFGLNGVSNPGNTSGTFTISATVSTTGEAVSTNNSNAIKFQAFKQ